MWTMCYLDSGPSGILSSCSWNSFSSEKIRKSFWEKPAKSIMAWGRHFVRRRGGIYGMLTPGCWEATLLWWYGCTRDIPPPNLFLKGQWHASHENILLKKKNGGGGFLLLLKTNIFWVRKVRRIKWKCFFNCSIFYREAILIIFLFFLPQRTAFWDWEENVNC